MKTTKIARTYQNPICLERKYKQIIDNGQLKNQADLLIIQELEKLGDPLKSKIIYRVHVTTIC